MRNLVRQRGTSLIEVLVAVVVLAVGLLGVAGMQMSALRNNQSAYQRSVAAMLASSIAERMEANRTNAQAGAYNLAVGAPGCNGPGVGSLALQDLDDWISEMQGPGMLGPLRCGGVACNGPLCTITILWQDDRTGVDGTETPTIVLEVRL